LYANTSTRSVPVGAAKLKLLLETPGLPNELVLPLSAKMLTALAPEIALASTDPVSVPVAPVLGVVEHGLENEDPSSALASAMY